MRTPLIAGAIAVFVLASANHASAQISKTLPFNEREITPQVLPYDKKDVWTLHFRFKDPRIIPVDVPGRGKKIVWYMWYQVYNPLAADGSGEPRLFVPRFDLKTHDYETVHSDEIMPAVLDEISKIEDPTGLKKMKDSYTIIQSPIPLSKPDSYPRIVTGVAIWTDVYDRAPKTNRFSIFISGLSDGWREVPAVEADKPPMILRKTLQLNYERLGEGTDASSIRWVDNPQWIYRATDPLEKEAAKEPGAAAPGRRSREMAIVEPIKTNNSPARKE